MNRMNLLVFACIFGFIKTAHAQESPVPLFQSVSTPEGGVVSEQISSILNRPGVMSVKAIKINIDEIINEKYIFVEDNLIGLPSPPVGLADSDIDTFKLLYPQYFEGGEISLKKTDNILSYQYKNKFFDSTLIENDGRTFGRLSGQDGSLYKIEPAADLNTHLLIEVKSGDNTDDHPDEHPTGYLFEENVDSSDINSNTNEDSEDECSNIGVIVAYTQASIDENKNLISNILLEFELTNKSFIDSGIPINVSLEKIIKIENKESGRFDNDLKKVAIDKNLEEIRKNNNGDLLIFVTKKYSEKSCGLAYKLPAHRESAFAAISNHCIDGIKLTLPHEIGHLMGLRHNLEHDPLVTPFRYGHGIWLFGETRNDSTIMAKNCLSRVEEGCIRQPLFSSPRFERDGIIIGTEEYNDSARVLIEQRCRISKFY